MGGNLPEYKRTGALGAIAALGTLCSWLLVFSMFLACLRPDIILKSFEDTMVEMGMEESTEKDGNEKRGESERDGYEDDDKNWQDFIPFSPSELRESAFRYGPDLDHSISDGELLANLAPPPELV
jgi:hypothetical protein